MCDLFILLIVPTWILLGWIYIGSAPVPTTNRETIKQLIFGGPLLWIVFIALAITHIICGKGNTRNV